MPRSPNRLTFNSSANCPSDISSRFQAACAIRLRRWEIGRFASLFAGASHILHPHGLDKYIAAPDAVLMAPSLRDVEAASRLRNPPPLYVTYASPGRDGARGGWRSSTGAGAIVCASEADATFVPVPARTSMPAPASLTSYYSRSPSQISEESEVAMDEPILMSRTRL